MADALAGVFETVLVVDGRPVAADAHLERLGRSLRELYGRPTPVDLAGRLTAEAAPLSGRHRLRVDAVPSGDEVRITLTASPLVSGSPAPVSCRAVIVAGGLGAHKLRDRRRLNGLTARGVTPLLVDSNGDVLEAAWGNLWLREGDRLITPPADGRLLPGVTRARLLALAPELGFAAGEETVTVPRLASASAVFLTSALRLAVAAAILPDTATTAAALDGAWLARLRCELGAAGSRGTRD